eukprot:08836.XXX_244132_245169_1 [CDS] Oithona nana genome sequencing.
MRTGSTYFGQLVGQYNQTYYHYEPLHYYSSRGNNWTKFSDEFAINLIQNIYKCQFDTPEMSELITNHSLSMGMAWQLPYFKNSCIKRKNCSDPIIQTKLCKESEINLIKTVRLRSWALKTLMKQDSKLKVILLVRDPRSLINSRKHGFCGKDIKMPNCENATAYCHELQEDVKESLALDKLYPGRIKIVRFEDLEQSREKIMLETYKFLNKKVTEDQWKKFFSYYSHHNTKKQFSRKGKSDAELVKRWMIMMNRTEATYIQTHCRGPMKLLGYPSRQDIWTKEQVVGKPSESVQKILIQ